MIYVDSMKAKYGRMIMCHMIADTKDELLLMADKIGVNRKWIQKENTHREHFDISLQARALAVRYGAKEITWKELGEIVLRRKLPSEDKQ